MQSLLKLKFRYKVHLIVIKSLRKGPEAVTRLNMQQNLMF